jgi:N-acetylglucosaminyl-diphospho-decaprenol L-rhamnosyltransferase
VGAESGATPRAASTSPRADVSVVVVTYNALPWIERCLASIEGYDTVVVDHGSTDGTVEEVRTRFPDVRIVTQENLGLGAGWNRGIRETSGSYVLILNADAWALDDAVDRLAAFADAHPRAAVIGPRLSYPDGRLQPSVRGFPTPWRVATEYLFLRKLAPRSHALNAFYAAGFDHASVRAAEFVMGAVLLVRRAAIDDVGLLDEDFFLFSEETDWCYRFRGAGWQVLFTPAAEFSHVAGAAHAGSMFRENVRGILRFIAKHEGARSAARTRWIVLAGCLLRAPRDRQYLRIARWLASGRVPKLLARR